MKTTADARLEERVEPATRQFSDGLLGASAAWAATGRLHAVGLSCALVASLDSRPATAAPDTARGSTLAASPIGVARLPAAADPWLPGPEERRLIDAKALLAAGEAERALALLEARAGAIDDYRAYVRAQTLLVLGKKEGAFSELERIAPPEKRCARRAALEHPLYADAALLKARILAEGEPTAAAEILVALNGGADVLAEAAELYRRAGDRSQAEALEARLLVERPETPEARAIARDLRPAGVRDRLGGPGERLERARRLLDAHQNVDARDEATQLLGEIEKESPHRCELLFIIGKADRKLRSYASSVKFLSEARERCEDAREMELMLKAALLEVQVRAIRGDVAGTRTVASLVAKTHPDHSYTDDALMFLGNLFEDVGRRLEAKRIYRRIADEIPGGDQALEAAWRLGYRAYRDEDLDEASKRFGWILGRADAPPIERARARFWLARTLENRDEARARTLYEETALEPSFYAWLALERLERAHPAWAVAIKKRLLVVLAPTPGAPPGERPGAPQGLRGTLAGAPELDRARRLYAAGAPLYAEGELELLACDALDDDETLALALAFDSIGAHPRAQQLLRSRASTMLAGPFRPETLDIWRAAYSRPFAEAVEKAARAAKVEALFLLALVREESTFDPQIVSWAGATGLAQLMPDTAMSAHASLGLGRLDLERLTDPETNLRLGAKVLRDGLKAFGEQEPLALVAYNGGPAVARRLSALEKAKPFEEWVEDISIRETRRYVKRVLETWGIYRLLYDREHPFIALPATLGGRG